MRIDSEGRAHAVVEVPNQPSGLGWLPDGRLLVVSMLDRKLMRLDATGLAMAADLSGLAAFPCNNDMVVDASGRAYIGNFGFDIFVRPVEPRPTVLAMVAPDGKVSVAADDAVPQWHRDRAGWVHHDSGRDLWSPFDGVRHRSDGTLANRRLWADLDNIAPDGICLDAEGAVGGLAAQQRVRACAAGRAHRATNCQFAAGHRLCIGGADGRTLFMVSGRVRPHAESLAERTGRIDAVRVDVPAAAPPRCL